MVTKEDLRLKILEKPDEFHWVEGLQRIVWPGNETEVVPTHVLVAVVHNGGLVIGAFRDAKDADGQELIGFVFGFPGAYTTPDGPRLKHCSHMLGVHPSYRDSGVGFKLKRAQWQMVRHQGIDLITWTYDPLLSRNAQLNIAKLGAICNAYIKDFYGELRDGLNVGVPTDRFEVSWWVNTRRVERRLSYRARRRLDLAHYFGGGAKIINPTKTNDQGLPIPGEMLEVPVPKKGSRNDQASLFLVEIPSDYLALKAADSHLAIKWRLHTRDIFQHLFTIGYLVTDFVYLPGSQPRSFYVLTYGESTL